MREDRIESSQRKRIFRYVMYDRRLRRTNKNNIGQTIGPMGWEKSAKGREWFAMARSKVYIFD